MQTTAARDLLLQVNQGSTIESYLKSTGSNFGQSKQSDCPHPSPRKFYYSMQVACRLHRRPDDGGSKDL
jgi:hypothetical protein